MQTLYPASYMADTNWFLQESQSSDWTKEENKLFESALAIYDEKTPDRWVKIARMIPGKTVFDVFKQYKELEDDVTNIEAGLVEIPGYQQTSAFTLELVDDQNFDANRKRSAAARGSDQERKKGIPWTEDEHLRFLKGLLQYGKGDWRSISRNFVMSKTPTQVASHAQKYFMRQHSGGKDKRRPSIHDITTVNLTSTTTTSPSQNNNRSPLDQSPPPEHNSKSTESPRVVLDWNIRPNDGVAGAMIFGATHGDLFESSSPYDVGSPEDLKLHWQNLYASTTHYAAHARSPSSMYLMHPSRHQIHG
ncbi:PREDICTED: transcription factor DIVARICATA-like [Fragaria vesca subsp. vesca]|uniref:transcription factor DIVARICATA-like n=1 Tax=Fragaria vesca subsp. vesca TaxID=101020 RepID=UPI0002C3079D|nr:PREDICTED: transcription factor DIVARICATA-like [Fragaria vesca subsp. vesca]